MALGATILSDVVMVSGGSIASGTGTSLLTDITWTSGAIETGSTNLTLMANVQLAVTFDASSTGDVEVYAKKDSNDNIPAKMYSTTIANNGVSPYISYVTVPYYGFSYLEIGVNNLDTSYGITWTVKAIDIHKMTGMATV